MLCVRHCSFAVIVMVVTVFELMPVTVCSSESCRDAESPLLCHGSRAVRSVVDQVLDRGHDVKSFRIVPGLEIVRLQMNETSSEFGGRSSSSGGSNGYIERIFKYLQGHELQINFYDLLKKSDLHGALSRTFNGIETDNEIVEGRKKDKEGMSTVLITALMMKKMLAALGMGAVAALAAKALGVALLALLLSALVGLKKLSESNQSEGTHHVQYVTAREISDDLPLPYRGWAPTQPENKF